MRSTICFMLTTLALNPQSAHAQQLPSHPPGTAIASIAPGKVPAVAVIEISATVVGIDKGTRTLRLTGPKGRTVDIVAGDDVLNFDQIRAGDSVVAKYREAFSSEVRKARGPTGAPESTSTRQRPRTAMGREIHVLGNVVEVDPARSIISLKGPEGKVVDIKVPNHDHFKMVKKGDLVEAIYTEASAVAVTPVSGAAGKSLCKSRTAQLNGGCLEV